MEKRLSRKVRRKRIVALVERMDDELYEWRKEHPNASLDEIVAQMTPRRRQLMGEWIGQLAGQAGNGAVIEGLACAHCGQLLVYKGDLPREQEHLEGETTLMRAYYYCPQCQQGIFPPRPAPRLRIA
jgi:rubredoxin